MPCTSRSFFAVAVVAAAILAACGRKDDQARVDSAAGAIPTPAPAPATNVAAFRVTSVDLGKAIGPDRKVTAPTTTFGVRDTIYAVVSSEGSSTGANLHIRWLGPNGEEIARDSTTIQPTGPAATEFHLAKASPWPVGRYQVIVTADGQQVGTTDFEVRK